MEVLGYCAAVFIGILLGMIGSGGSILTVPVLVYLMNIHPSLATTSSLFIVGATSLVGGIKAFDKKQVDFNVFKLFGISSIFSIFITRHYLLPAIPDYLFSIGQVRVSKDMLLMIIFAILMLVASLFIITNQEDKEPVITKRENNNKTRSLIILGLVIGMITGSLGAGGGFLIIPFLVFFLRLPLKTAVGTSLLIVAANSLFGFLVTLNQFKYDWTLLLVFSALAITGILAGSQLSDKIPTSILKKGFGWFVLLMGIYIIIREVFF